MPERHAVPHPRQRVLRERGGPHPPVGVVQGRPRLQPGLRQPGLLQRLVVVDGVQHDAEHAVVAEADAGHEARVREEVPAAQLASELPREPGAERELPHGGADAAADAGADTGADAAADAGADAAAHTGPNPGAHAAADPCADPGPNPGADTCSDTGPNPGPNPSAHAAADTGAHAAADAGTDADPVRGAEPEPVAVAEPEPEPVADGVARGRGRERVHGRWRHGHAVPARGGRRGHDHG